MKNPPPALDPPTRERTNNMRDIEQYKTNRLKPQIAYYSEKSRKNQRYFYRLSVIDLFFTALVPVASLLSNNYITALLGAGATITSGILLLYKPKDLWTKYRIICEILKSYEIQFDNRIGEYATLSDEDAIKNFIEKCEQLMTEEHNSWESLYAEAK